MAQYEERYERLYPKLKYFFSAYFHSDWKSTYDWQGEPPSFQVVVRDFKTNNSQATVTQATQELEQFLTEDLTEASHREIVVHKLGANIYAPPGLGLTYQQWLKDILTILKEREKESDPANYIGTLQRNSQEIQSDLL